MGNSCPNVDWPAGDLVPCSKKTNNFSCKEAKVF